MFKPERTIDVAESNTEYSYEDDRGDIRALVRSNKPANATKPSNDVAATDDVMAAGATSIADIEGLMAELLVARDYLQAEGERVRRVNANYAHLAQTASASVKVIAEGIGKWRIPEQVPGNQALAASGRTHAPAPSLARDGELQRDQMVS
jgi:hypothetical protein